MKIIEMMEKAVLSLANVALFITMSLVSVDAVMRYVFRAPIPGVMEFLENYLIVIIVYWGISSAFKHNRHISVDILFNKFTPRVQSIISILTNILVLLFSIALLYQNYLLTINAWMNNEIHFGIVKWPMYLAYAVLPVGLFILVLRVSLTILSEINNMRLSYDKDK